MVINKNSPEAGTCYKKGYHSFFQGFNVEIKDTFFFAFVIQFLLILMMYFHVGNGRYWKILFYSSIAGLCGAVIEHATVAYICQISELENYTKATPLLLNECFWIISEYSIPILNLIKMNTLATPKIAKITKLTIILLAVPFSTVRLLIGWDRMINGYLSSELGRELHGIWRNNATPSSVVLNGFSKFVTHLLVPTVIQSHVPPFGTGIMVTQMARMSLSRSILNVSSNLLTTVSQMKTQQSQTKSVSRVCAFAVPSCAMQ